MSTISLSENNTAVSELIKEAQGFVQAGKEWFPQLAISLGIFFGGWCAVTLFTRFLKRRCEQMRMPTVKLLPTSTAATSEGELLETEDSDEDLSDREKSNVGAPIDPTLLTFLIKALDIGLKMLLVLVCASIVGIHMTSFIAILTAMSLAIGLSMQGLLSDLAQGVMLILFRPFKEGDTVIFNAAGIQGDVHEIGVFQTLLVSDDNMLHIVPNSEIKIVTNVSAMGRIRMDEAFMISNDEDWLKVKRLLVECANSVKYVHKDPLPEAVITTFNENGVTASLRAYVKPTDEDEYRFLIRERVKLSFQKYQIRIPRNADTDPRAG